MTLKEVRIIENVLMEFADFASSNSDMDESGIFQDMEEIYFKATKILEEEKYRLFLRNAKAKIRREAKNK